MDDDYEPCPKCNQSFVITELVYHVGRCPGISQPNVPSNFGDHGMDVDGEDTAFPLALPLHREEEEAQNRTSKRPHISEDEAFARSLAEKEKTRSETSTIKCQLCSKGVSSEDLYILDECTHRFCKTCIKDYVEKKVSTSVALECPFAECKKALSVRDMKDLLPNKEEKPSFFTPTKGTGKATERIMAEMKHIMKAEPEKNGYAVQPVGENLYKWELKFFNFDKTDPLGQDMAAHKVKNIILNINFPSNYPFSPPYIRVINPRFQYRTGHVTIGGSICMEVLTNKGWSPANTLEAIIVSIRAQLIAGNARLDPVNLKHPYSEQEAKEAFDRMVRDHGWQ